MIAMDPDPIAAAEAADRALAELAEMGSCAWPNCDAPATPVGEPYELWGVDFDGTSRPFPHRRYVCAAGHRWDQLLEDEDG